MLTYITAFIFYTAAMIGILLVGFVVYKKTFVNSKIENKGLIKIIDSQMIAPKKTLLIVKIKNEHFLIASDASTTTFLSKLESFNEQEKMLDEYRENDNSLKTIKNINERRKDISFKKQLESENKTQNDFEKRELELAQKQFMDLYNNTGTSQTGIANKISAKKEVIKKLLRELEDGKTEIGSKF